MHKRVQDILERELNRLDLQSQKSGLELDDFRRLDLLIKAHRSFQAPADPKSDPASPENQSTEELLKSLEADSKKKS